MSPSLPANASGTAVRVPILPAAGYAGILTGDVLTRINTQRY
ncbi:hypothetical protein HMPREF0994_03519 [Lachnospiraceae bacterium 3_1_57FAA_CT1]|nr:hypothetical protein HMPREF0994_03519 [Lachnospiraceae bacterium 3_1_57FAA_CT1]